MEAQPEMEFSASEQALLAEDLCQIVEGFVEYLKIRLWKRILRGFPQNGALYPQIGNFNPCFP